LHSKEEKTKKTLGMMTATDDLVWVVMCRQTLHGRESDYLVSVHKTKKGALKAAASGYFRVTDEEELDKLAEDNAVYLMSRKQFENDTGGDWRFYADDATHRYIVFVQAVSNESQRLTS
jgi:hypothetical protein